MCRVKKWNNMVNTYHSTISFKCLYSKYTYFGPILVYIKCPAPKIMIEDTFISSKWGPYLVFLGFLNSLIEIKTLLNIHVKQKCCQYNFYAT